jgi:hypothetical protein
MSILLRFLIFFIPIATFLVPQRFFGFYAAVMGGIVAYVLFMFTLVREETNQILLSFGVEVAAAYILLNLALLGVRYLLIRRARARILKLPAPAKKE